MSRLAVLARRDHPKGWGAPAFEKCNLGQYHPGDTPGTAHGYVVLLVECETDDEASELTAWCGDSKPIVGIFDSDWWDTWYGGVFDLVAWVAPIEGLGSVGVPAAGHAPKSKSLGDNRYVGVVKFSHIPTRMEGSA